MERFERIRARLREKGLGILLTLIGLLIAVLGGWILYAPPMENIDLLGKVAVIIGLSLLLPGGLLLT